MAYIEWNPQLSVQNEQMDQHHQKLFKLINDLHDALKIGKGKDVAIEISKDLYAYTLYHFSEEESLVRDTCPEFLEEQIREHSEFISKLSTLQEKINTGQHLTLGIETSLFLDHWLKEHIKISDKKYIKPSQ